MEFAVLFILIIIGKCLLNDNPKIAWGTFSIMILLEILFSLQ